MPELRDVLRSACELHRDSIAIEGPNLRVTYGGLLERAAIFADMLRAAGVAKDEAVIVPAGNAPDDVAKLLGTWLAECVFVPVHPSASPDFLLAVRKKSGARLSLFGDRVERDAEIGENRLESLLPGAALIIFTSGSSGEPKGVVLRHDRQYRKLQSSQSMIDLSRSTRFYMPLQLTFIFGIWSVLLTLFKGGVVILPGRFEAARAPRDLLTFQASDAAFVPTMLRLMLAEPHLPDPSSGLRIITAGEFMDPALTHRITSALCPRGLISIYGLTETGAADFFRMPHQAHDSALGTLAAGVEFRIKSQSESEVEGELQIRTPNGMAGYLGEAGLTEAAFDGDFLRTGDIARVRNDGEVEIVGRLKDVIVRGAVKISASEIDAAMSRHPDVSSAVCAGIPDPLLGEKIHVAIVPRAGGDLNVVELMEWATRELGRHKSPDQLHIFETLPTGRTGKSDRSAVRTAILDRQLQTGSITPV